MKLTELKHSVIAIVVFFLVIVVNIFIVSRPELLVQLEHIGWGGLLLLSILSGFNIAVPIPVQALYPTFLALGYAPLIVISIMSVGMTLGDTIGFVIGANSKTFVAKRFATDAVTSLSKKHPLMLMGAVFLYGAFVPLPNELLVIPLAALGARWYHVLVPLLFGNIIFTCIIAFGVSWITALFL